MSAKIASQIGAIPIAPSISTMSFTISEKIMLALTTVMARLAVFMMFGIVLKLLEIRIPSAVMLAMFAPAPMAIPKLLLANTGLSLMPSPTKITFSPLLFNSSIIFNLSCGKS